MINKASTQRIQYLKKRRNTRIKITTLRVIILLSIIALWELLTHFKIIDPFIVSSPSRCINTIINLYQEGSLFSHIGITMLETVLGFILGTVLGVIVAILLWYSETTRRVCEPYLIVLNALPKIALGPIIIVWIGSGLNAIVTITLLISVVVTIIGVLNGFTEVDKEKIFLLKTFGANKRQIFTKVVFPGSIPTTIATLKINVGMAWVGVIVGEFLSSKSGLGYLLVYGGQVFKLDLVMASIIILCILAAIMYYFVNYLEKKINKLLSD